MGAWTARQIWNVMSREEREAAARALWSDEHVDRVSRARALAPWLAARGLRLQYLEKLPRTRRAALMAEGGVPEATAEQLLISLHLVHRRELLIGFLDAVKIPHDKGLIDPDSDHEPVEGELVAGAIEMLRRRFPGEQVELYLRTLTATDATTFAAVGERIDGPA